MIESHEMKDCRIEIVDFDRIGCGFESELVTLSITESFFYSGSGEEAGKGFRIVVASGSVSLK